MLRYNIRVPATSLATLAVILWFVIPLGFAQQSLGLASADSGLHLAVSADRSVYHLGEAVNIAAEFRNVISTPVFVAIARPEEVFFRFNVVRMDGKNLAVPAVLTDVGRERTDPTRLFGIRTEMLPRNEAVAANFDIQPWYVWYRGLIR